MSEYNNAYVQNQGLTFSQYLTKVFGTTALGLGISAVISYLASLFLFNNLTVGSVVIIALCVVQLGLNIFFCARLEKMSTQTAWICYILYAALTGVTLSTIFYAYDLGSIALAFVVTCVMFVVMAIIGHSTKVDLSKFSGLIFPALIGLIIASVINIFLKSEMITWIVCYAGIIIFLGLIAYDTQKLRLYYQEGLSNPGMNEKFMIFGAFGLYLDFINLFIRLLEIFGKKNDD